MKPILFNTEMVRAILDGRKTVTRRVVKPQPPEDFLRTEKDRKLIATACAMCRPGDILYVRETWALVNESVGMGLKTKKIIYRANYSDIEAEGWKWRPSIHMPREAARIFLRVMGVRVERLQQITDEQATVEGIRFTDFGMYQPSWKASLDGGKTFHPAKPIHHPGYHAKDVFKPEQCFPTARGAFANLWDSTIKPADRDRYGWAANPWVWVIAFERCEKPEEAKT